MALFTKSCKDNVETILRNSDRLDEFERRLNRLTESVQTLSNSYRSISEMEQNIMEMVSKLLEQNQPEPVIVEPPVVVSEEQPDDTKVRRRMNTKYDPSLEYLNSVQLVDKYKGHEIELFGRKKISTHDINRMLCEYGLAKAYESAGGYIATFLGLKTGLLFNNNNSHLTFKNCDETDRMLSMLFNNPLKTKAYLKSLKEIIA